jgi:hypothetical protein
MATDIVIPEKERWTYEDYMNLTPPDSFGFQIIRGKLVVSPSPKRRHQRTILSLGRILDIRHLGRILDIYDRVGKMSVYAEFGVK